MIVLYRTRGCPRCSAVQEALEEMALAHRVVEVDSPSDVAIGPSVRKLPVLCDGEEVFEGAAAVGEHLKELRAFRKLWYKYQSDACYCDDDEDVG
jgi:glutaredoxin